MTVQKVRRTILFCSFLLFPVTFMYMSPVMSLGGSYFGLVTFGLLFWAGVLLTAPFLGRAFCAWVCPLGGEQDCTSAAAVDKRLISVRGLHWTKWLIWAAWVGAVAFFAFRAGGYHKLDLMWENPGFPPYEQGAHLFWLGFALLPVLLALTLGRRAFCRYLCFFSPLTIIGATAGRWLRLPRLGVHVVAAEQCKACGKCVKGCPMSLDVTVMAQKGALDDPECIACGTCAANCPSGVLRYCVGR